jgi:glycosyltransferase involved in cell wall biosynthesis
MRVVAITQIWPNSVEPTRAPFNRQQFRCLAQHCDLQVLAALAHLPGAALLPGKFRPPRVRELAALPAVETIDGIETHYMRQVYVPRVGVPVAVPLYLASMAPHRELLAQADVFLGTWAYPDGCAAILAAKAMRKPCVVKVHGTDLNHVARIKSARAVLRRILPRVDAMISVSAPLSKELEALGVAPSKVHLVANGVDTSLFFPRDKAEARRAFGIAQETPLVVFVGRLESAKGIGELLEAIPRVRERLPGARFALVGSGGWSEKLKGLGDVVIAPGARPLAEVAKWLAASDVFTLPSWMEGTPNVVLEALASGRPAVATRVGGIPDVLPVPDAGELVPPKDPPALADALVRTLERVKRGELGADQVRRFGPGSWEESAKGMLQVLEAVAKG